MTKSVGVTGGGPDEAGEGLVKPGVGCGMGCVATLGEVGDKGVGRGGPMGE